MAVRRPRRRLLALAAGVAFVLGAPAQTAAQDAGEPSGYEFFSASATADGITALYEIINLLPINRPVDVSTVTAEARFETTRSTALAVLPYPGDAVLNVPGTVAGLMGQSLPGYPLVARADHPTVPEQTVTPAAGTVPGVSAVKLTAAADGTAAGAEAAAADLVSAGLFAVGQARTTAASRATSPTSYETRAVSVVGDVDLAGGAIHLDSITSVVELVFADGEATVRENTVTVKGATVAGQAARVTNRGLELAGTGQDAPLDDVVELAPGLTVRTTQGTSEKTEFGARATAGAVVVEYTTVLQGAPSRAQLLLGGADAAVEARGPIGAAAPSDGTAGGGLVPAVSSGSLADAGGTTGLNAIPPRPGPGGLRPAAPTPTPFRGAPVGLVDPIDFRPVYGWLALAGLAVVGTRRWIAVQTARARTAPSDLHDLWRW